MYLTLPRHSQELVDAATLLAHVTPCYPRELASFPMQLVQLLEAHHLVMHGSLRKVIIHNCALTHTQVCLDSFVRVPYRVRVCAMTHPCVPTRCIASSYDARQVAQSNHTHVCHDSSVCVPYRVRVCHDSSVRHSAFVCVSTRCMTLCHSYLSHDSSIYVP